MAETDISALKKKDCYSYDERRAFFNSSRRRRLQDRIEIYNFGGLPKGLKPEEFGTKSVLRNPTIADLLNRAEYIEKMGTGIKKIRRLIREARIKPPKFKFTTFFTIVFPRPTALKRIARRTVEKTREKILRLIKENKLIATSELANKSGVTLKAIEWQISKLKQKKLLKRIGPDRGGRWEVLEGRRKQKTSS